MRTVSVLSIAPVKSTALHHPERVRLERYGVPENRRFYFLNARGRLFSGSRFGPLVAIRSEYDSEQERLELHFPDGSAVADAVRVHGPARTTSFWGRPVKGREVAGPFGEAVSEYAGEPVRLLRSERPGDGNDSHPASLVSSASVRELQERSGAGGPLDSRRFRMLIEFDGIEPHEEDGWLGRAVRIGDATVRVIRPDPRCVVTTQDPSTGIKDFDTLKELRRYREGEAGRRMHFGVYADVTEPGTIRVGDPVDPL